MLFNCNLAFKPSRLCKYDYLFVLLFTCILNVEGHGYS